MSVPTSMKVGPFTSLVLVKKRDLLYHIFLIWISIISVALEYWVYWQLLWDYDRPLHFYIFLPLLGFAMYLTAVFTAMVFAKILLILINFIHKPKEGVFLRDPSDKDYRYWGLRNVIKQWPFWLTHRFPFPFLDNLAFKLFGVKTKFSNSLFEGWIDTEFVEFGKNVVVGQATYIQSTMIIGNLLIIRKTTIDDNVRIGAQCMIMPGTHIGKNCILNAWSATIVGQELEDGWIYLGGPAQKFKKNKFFEDDIEAKIKLRVDNLEELSQTYDSQYDKWNRKKIKKEKKEEEKRRIMQGL